MNYQRVVPRDFFNESKLLKCLGKIEIYMMDRYIPIATKHDGRPFNIQMDVNGGLFVKNYKVFKQTGEEFHLFSRYNSKESWPLEFADLSWEIVDDALDDNGLPTQEFMEFLES